MLKLSPILKKYLNMIRYQSWIQKRLNLIFFLFTAMLLGNDANRKAFATLFTKNFGQMMKEFITDDHEHSVSVTSLSVQLFTVPTLAHYLIAHQDVLATLLRYVFLTVSANVRVMSFRQAVK